MRTVLHIECSVGVEQWLAAYYVDITDVYAAEENPTDKTISVHSAEVQLCETDDQNSYLYWVCSLFSFRTKEFGTIALKTGDVHSAHPQNLRLWLYMFAQSVNNHQLVVGLSYSEGSFPPPPFSCTQLSAVSPAVAFPSSYTNCLANVLEFTEYVCSTVPSYTITLSTWLS